MGTLQLPCIQIAIALVLLTQAKSATEEISVHPNNTTTRCIASERSALATYREGFSDPANRLSSWKGDDCCRWKGVICSNKTGHVIGIDLGSPDCNSMHELGGKISSSLLGLQHLRYLDLSCNRFEELQIPEFLGSLHNLRYIDLSLTSFAGRIPPQLGNLSNLRYFSLDSIFGDTYSKDISWLSRSLPTWIGQKLPSLAFMRLRSNMFHGHIPEELTKIVDLQYLDLAYNNINGSVPRSIGNWKRMVLTGDGDDGFEDAFSYGVALGDNEMVDYSENFTVLTKGQERLYTGEVIYMVNLDLSCNSLTGEIPDEITTLVALKSLNLSWNMFSAKIPEKIGALVQVESLDLSHNELSGEIPTSLSALTSLSRLNLSYNDLTGVVPSGNQLQTLEDPLYIYIGNLGLCGLPLPRNCSQLEPIPSTQELHEDAGDVVSFFIAMGCGYVIAIWVVFCTLLFKRKWRVSWFSHCDSVYDRIYVLVALAWASLTSRSV